MHVLTPVTQGLLRAPEFTRQIHPNVNFTRKGSLAHLLTFSMVSLKLLKMILYMEKANIICPNPYQNRSVTLQMRAKNKSMLETLFIDEFHSS